MISRSARTEVGPTRLAAPNSSLEKQHREDALRVGASSEKLVAGAARPIAQFQRMEATDTGNTTM
jgi:hypothetical protein